MERERYCRMRMILREVERQHHDTPRCTHRDSKILLVALWAGLHNKPIDWATHHQNWPGDLRPRSPQPGQRALPSQSCMSRRLRGKAESATRNADDSLFQLLERWQQRLREQLPNSDVKLIDGRGLVIGGASKDPDAGFGYCAGTKANGYKLHWIVDLFSGAVDGWLVAPMNYPEQHAAQHLIAHLPEQTRYVLGDNSYDSNALYEQAGQQRQVQWMAAPRSTAKGLGHKQPSNWRVQMQPWLRSDQGKRTMKERIGIEQVNGRLGCSSVGLNHLPYHARRLHRVTLWVALKMLILTDLQIESRCKKCA
jgi:hypothetical protein